MITNVFLLLQLLLQTEVNTVGVSGSCSVMWCLVIITIYWSSHSPYTPAPPENWCQDTYEECCPPVHPARCTFLPAARRSDPPWGEWGEMVEKVKHWRVDTARVDIEEERECGEVSQFYEWTLLAVTEWLEHWWPGGSWSRDLWPGSPVAWLWCWWWAGWRQCLESWLARLSWSWSASLWLADDDDRWVPLLDVLGFFTLKDCLVHFCFHWLSQEDENA